MAIKNKTAFLLEVAKQLREGSDLDQFTGPISDEMRSNRVKQALALEVVLSTNKPATEEQLTKWVDYVRLTSPTALRVFEAWKDEEA